MTAIRIDEMAAPYDETITIPAGTPVVRVFDCVNGQIESVSGENTGSHAIESVGVELSMVSDTNSEYQHQTAAEASIGSVAAGAPFTWSNTGDPHRFARFTFNSASGTTLKLQARAL